jgi:hypothetical protein
LLEGELRRAMGMLDSVIRGEVYDSRWGSWSEELEDEDDDDDVDDDEDLWNQSDDEEDSLEGWRSDSQNSIPAL